jgi:polar amino acid transport system substrate-binding protein
MKKHTIVSMLTAAALIGTLAVSGTALADDSGEVTVIKAATNGSPAPYMTVDENNELQGSDIDIIRAVFDRLPQYELQIEVTSDALTGLQSGQYQIAVNNYGWREERGETYYYSLPYKTGYDVYIQRADDEPLTGLQDLADRGYKTEVGAGSLKASALEAWNEENPDHQIDIVYSEVDFQQKFQHIVDGVTDVAIDDGPILDTLITQFGLEDELVGNEIDEETQAYISPHNSSYFLFPKDEAGEALREDVDQVLVELKEDGTLAEILTGYFGRDTSPSEENMQETLN